MELAGSVPVIPFFLFSSFLGLVLVFDAASVVLVSNARLVYNTKRGSAGKVEDR